MITQTTISQNLAMPNDACMEDCSRTNDASSGVARTNDTSTGAARMDDAYLNDVCAGDVTRPGGIRLSDSSFVIPYIEAHGLTLKTHAGYQFHDVGLQVSLGKVLAICGDNGSGKTALLLTLAGRMKATSGFLRVGKWRLPKQRAKAMHQVGLALFEGANDVQDNLHVRDAILMELELFGRPTCRASIDAYLEEWDLRSVEKARVTNLTASERIWLGIALAFAGFPSAVVVDNIEGQLTLLQSKDLMARLIQQAHNRDVAIVVGVVERMLAKMADDCVFLEAHRVTEARRTAGPHCATESRGDRGGF